MLQKYYGTPFAISGDKTAIPDAIDPNGYVSYTQGFTADYARVLGTDTLAKQIQRQTIDQLFYDVTLNLQSWQQFGCPEFITSANNGGSPFPYGRGALVRYSASGTAPFDVFLSVVGGNTTTPPSAIWIRLTGNLDTVTDCNTAYLGQSLINTTTANGPFPGSFGFLETRSTINMPGPTGSSTLVQFAYNLSDQSAPWYRENVNNSGYGTWVQLATAPQLLAAIVAAEAYANGSFVNDSTGSKKVFPGGYTIITGNFMAVRGARTQVLFPHGGFPGGCVNVGVNYQANTPPPTGAVGSDTFTTGGFYYYNSFSAGGGGTDGCIYRADGY